MLADLADAVVASLNAGTFSLPFVAERVAVPEVRLTEMDSLHVTVVPRRVQNEILSRNSDVHEVQVDVAVQQRVADLTNEAIDPLLALVEEIAAHLNRRPMAWTGPPAGSAAWRKTEFTLPYSAEHLREMKQFTSVLTVTYWVIE